MKKTQELFVKAWIDGYEVEKESKWIVKVNNIYFLNWGEDRTCPIFLINDHLNSETHAEHFLIKEDADSVVDLIGGIAVPAQLVNDRDDAIEFTLNNPYYDVTYTTD